MPYCPECKVFKPTPNGVGLHRWSVHGIHGSSETARRYQRKVGIQKPPEETRAIHVSSEYGKLYNTRPLDRAEVESIRKSLLYLAGGEWSTKYKATPKRILAAIKEVAERDFEAVASLRLPAVDPEDGYKLAEESQ